MKKIQCTFRLPQNIVDLIDKQDGGTRTDKLLSLLKVNDSTVIQSVIEPDYTLYERVNELERKLRLLEEIPRDIKSCTNNDSPNMNTHEDMIIECIRAYRFQDGLSAKDIANKLNALGYLTVALKAFTKGSVEGIIRRKL